ncbi:MAG TPA: hypothetical protein DCG69_04275 [Bacteroidales bacterium]|nr:hypothetical protein [Bacteroidales bacterium]
MKNQEQPNQNPEEVNIPAQEENAETVVQTVENHTETESPDAKFSETENEGEVINEVINEVTAIQNDVDESYDFGAEHADPEEEEDEDETELTDQELEVQYQGSTIAELLTALEVLLHENELQAIRSKASVLRRFIDQKMAEADKLSLEKFITEGGNEAEFSTEDNEDHQRYRKILDLYRNKRAKVREVQEHQQVQNLAKKNELLEELRSLVNSDETLKSTYDKFKEIQERWKEIGMIPKNEMGELWRNYHFLVEKFFDKVKISNELRDLDLKKSLEAKMQLCEKAEELLLEKSVTKSFKLLQKYHEEWKIIGPVPTQNKEEVWERFKAITDKINLRRRDHYKQLQDNLDDNYKAKLALIEKAEALSSQNFNSIKDWNKQTDALNDLLKAWKTIGPTPRKVNDEVWHRFKGHLNLFFAGKKKFYNEIKDDQNNNYQQKLAICIEAESLKDNTNWKKTTEILIKLQNDWKTIGPVPRKYSDVIWKRFRKACDSFFEAKSNHFKDLVDSESENGNLKSALIEEIKSATFSENKAENLELIKAFQRRWMELGNVPRKDMDRLNKAYREAVDAQLAKFHISGADFKNAGFKEKIHKMKEHEDNFHLNKERYGLQKTLEKMQEDVLVWENNMGFFANTKNAEVLMLDFDKKIKRAKAEIAEMKEKLRIIDKG